MEVAIEWFVLGNSHEFPRPTAWDPPSLNLLIHVLESFSMTPISFLCSGPNYVYSVKQKIPGGCASDVLSMVINATPSYIPVPMNLRWTRRVNDPLSPVLRDNACYAFYSIRAVEAVQISLLRVTSEHTWARFKHLQSKVQTRLVAAIVSRNRSDRYICFRSIRQHHSINDFF